MIPRNTTVNVSAAPATARAASVSHSVPEIANTANDRPHTEADTSIPSPFRDVPVIGPDSTALTMPPTPIEAVNRPRIRGSPPNRSALIAGNSDSGNAKKVADTSVRNAPASAGVRPMNDSPKATCRRCARGRKRAPAAGASGAGMAGRRPTPYSAAAKLTVSVR
ncbi:MAG TPA: hypothetical protein VI365_02400 [Trebonia sp.]